MYCFASGLPGINEVVIRVYAREPWWIGLFKLVLLDLSRMSKMAFMSVPIPRWNSVHSNNTLFRESKNIGSYKFVVHTLIKAIFLSIMDTIKE